MITVEKCDIQEKNKVKKQGQNKAWGSLKCRKYSVSNRTPQENSLSNQ